MANPTAYCSKCKARRTIKNPKKVIMNKKTAYKGKCGVCNEILYRIGPAE